MRNDERLILCLRILVVRLEEDGDGVVQLQHWHKYGGGGSATMAIVLEAVVLVGSYSYVCDRTEQLKC